MSSLIETFINVPENLDESLNRIRMADEPDIIDKDHLIKLGFDESSAILYVNLLSALGLINENGVPTSEFERFISSEDDARGVISKKVWEGYSSVFNEKKRIHEMSEKKIEGIFKKVLGEDKSDAYIKLLVKTFRALTDYCGWPWYRETVEIG